jgi:superfamily I DNA/RNA helicase
MDCAGADVAALSRVHRFLIPLALSMIKQTREFRYKGIADTVTRMNRMLYQSAKMGGDLTSIRQALTEYQQQLEDRYADKPKMPKWVIQAGEVTDCLTILLATVETDGGNMDTVKKYLKALEGAEKATSGPTLSTVHAAKGMEWSNVYLLGPMRSPLAATEAELYAEQCLEFVAVTRSSDKIILTSPE